MECGFEWAEWSATTVPDTAASCDDDGNTSGYMRQCVWINATHEALINSPGPELDNCGDERHLRTSHVPITSYCSYFSQRSVKELDGFILSRHAHHRASWQLRFDLFLRSGQTGSAVGSSEMEKGPRKAARGLPRAATSASSA